MRTRYCILALVLWSFSPLGAQVRIGYSGAFPSDLGMAALEKLLGSEWEDRSNLLGGGTWRIENGGVTPHPLGPACGDVLEMRSATALGPHLRIRRDHLLVCVPARTDGDVKATLQWLRLPVPAQLEGEPSQEWREAAARTEALGEAAHGLRVGLIPSRGQPARVTLLIWNVGDSKVRVVGKAAVVLDGVSLPTVVQWPQRGATAPSEVRYPELPPGSTFEMQVDVAELAEQQGRAKALGAGPHVVEFMLQPEPVGQEDERPELVRSRKATLVRSDTAPQDGGKAEKKR